MKYLILLAVLAHFLLLTNQYEILAEIPLIFQLAGNVSYTPTSGGVNIQGYILKVGFSRFSWVGIKFMTLTSRSTYDILVIQRQDVPVGGYYKTTVKDYFVSSARQDKLLSDSNNNMDKQSITYTDSNYFETEVYRTKGNTQGQDWQGGEFVHICFYTSANAFNQNVWTGLSESCYGYDISADYFSTFRGKYIGSMAVDGVSSAVYGGIQGPLLRLQLFWYCLKPTLSSANVFFRISDKISEQLGYDYHKCGVGDFFGANVDSLTADSLWSGYNDGVCTMTSSTLSTKIAYSRKVYTDDQYDSKIYNTTEICVRVGFSQACSVLNLQILFPVMTVESALIVWQSSLFYSLSLILATLVTLLSQK